FPSGVVVQADAGNPTTLTIQTCTKEGCRSVAQVSDELLRGFRQGKLLKVGFVAFGGTQTVVVDASLAGFTAAFKAMRSR
ncbi:MAG: invasion associated locus B family protein, partial [Alphaproteobacteria bacterium]|nr:invasion associated locus B family protein [Alphaproteobacteria bacterium]